MADARLLSILISRDERVAQLSPNSQLLFAYSIPALDNEGRMPGEPGAVRELAASLLPWSDDQVDAFIAEWTRTTRRPNGTLAEDPLVVRYPIDPPRRWRQTKLRIEFECRLGLQFTGFARNQREAMSLVRRRRVARSSLPPPDLDVSQLVLEAPGCPGASGTSGTSGRSESVRVPLHARARGLDRKAAFAFELKEQAAAGPLATTGASDGDTLGWLRAEFERVVGRAPSALPADKAARLVAAAERVGRGRVTELFAGRADNGPASLAYFLPALEELGAVARPAGPSRPSPTKCVPVAPDALLADVEAVAGGDLEKVCGWVRSVGYDLDPRVWRDVVLPALGGDVRKAAVMAYEERRREKAAEVREMMGSVWPELKRVD